MLIINYWICIGSCLLSFSAVNVQSSINARFLYNATTTRDCFIENRKPLECGDTKFSSLDGSCNNPLNPFAGKARTPFKRLLLSTNNNKFQPLRKSGSNLLPSPRVISNAMNNESEAINHKSNTVNGMFVQFGQYMSHDISNTAVANEENGKPVNCSCSNPSSSCINIPIPRNDPFYSSATTCIPLKGSKTVQGCDRFPPEQINDLTAYIDAETIYSTSSEVLKALIDPNSDYGALRLFDSKITTKRKQRTFGCPMMRRKSELLPNRKQVPSFVSKTVSCPAHFNSPVCFVSGEIRVNENIGLSSLHTIFAREHNRIAKRLKMINSHWDSDTVFNEARRIMIAIHQIITFGEYLPLLLGPKLIREFDLKNLKNGFYFGYDPTYDATVSNSFATAAFRYGHSQVGMFFHRPTANYSNSEEPSIRTFRGIFQQQAVMNGSTPAIMRGLMLDSAKFTDANFVDDLRNRLFQSATEIGKDLLAINIQRGREHGLSSYNNFREFCGLPKASCWSDFEDSIKSFIVKKLKTVYKSVDDVDLYMGGVAEMPLPGANVGPVFGCILGYQFRDLKKGDRFWFERPGQFSKEQLKELRKVKLSRIFCDNLNDMETISPNAMELPQDANKRIPCSQLPQMNIDLWKEQEDDKQDGEWTRWFLTQPMPKENMLQKIIIDHGDSVCASPIDLEVMPISDRDQHTLKVRYLCPNGLIRSSAFPNVKENLNYYWTTWFDRDSPSSTNGDDEEILKNIESERPTEVCKKPLYMQAQTKEGNSAYDSTEVFRVLNPERGLICKGNDQPGGRCEDYRVRFYCPKENKNKMKYRRVNYRNTYAKRSIVTYWTKWISTGSPSRNDYDVETIGHARHKGHAICSNPIEIEGRIIGTNISALDSGDVLKRFNHYQGLVCFNSDQTSGVCHDYEVRYLCQIYVAGNQTG